MADFPQEWRMGGESATVAAIKNTATMPKAGFSGPPPKRRIAFEVASVARAAAGVGHFRGSLPDNDLQGHMLAARIARAGPPTCCHDRYLGMGNKIVGGAGEWL
jgi:hypothetical protein